jgi:hypothetical protein
MYKSDRSSSCKNLKVYKCSMIALPSFLCIFYRFVNDPVITKYAKIAARLVNKTVRDVAMRCQWMKVCTR